MERYDGKTKKDDYKKYALIAAGVVAVIILYHLLTTVIYKVSHPTPDLTVVVGCEAIIDHMMEDGMEAELKTLAADLDGNGKTVVDVVPYDTRSNSAISESGTNHVGAQDGGGLFAAELEEGDALIFIKTGRDGFDGDVCAKLPEEMQTDTEPYCVEITDSKLIRDLGFKRGNFYAGIAKNATEAEYALAVEMLKQLSN